jgi:hypothetical protein
MQKKSRRKYSLVHPKGMGGIHGGKGYRFQDGYIVCQVPKWMADPNFLRFMPEGSGDVDVVFRDKSRHVYEHFQVKDHEVGKSEFVQVIKSFVEIDKGMGKVYRQFTLACPAVSKTIKSFEGKLKRYKEAKPLFDEANIHALQSTKSDLKNEFARLNLSKYSDFIERKVQFEIGQSNFSDNTVCRKLFVASLAEHPRYKQKLLEMLQPAYSVLIDAVVSHAGRVLHGNRIHSWIDAVIAGGKNIGRSTVLHVHNWTVEKFDNKPTVTLDWSKYFDRQTRKVPSFKIWNSKLIPELRNARETLSRKTATRNIIFRGKCTLSTGIAIGAAFPEIGNWQFELLQPPQTDPWRSFAEKIEGYELKYNLVKPSALKIKTGGSDIAFVFNVTGKALEEVANYLRANEISLKQIISVEPGRAPGNLSIQNEAEAVSLASASKDILKAMLVRFRANKTHLFFYGPLGLAIFLGQKLTSVGVVQLYEFQDPGYKPSCLIKS